MKQIQNNLIIALLLSITSTFMGCQFGRTGTYVVYDIKSNEHREQKPFGYDDSLSNILKNRLMDKKYHLTFNNNYVLVQNLSLGTQANIPLIEPRSEKVYSRSETRDSSTVTTTIKEDDQGNLLNIVSVSIPLKTRERGYGGLEIRNKVAFAVCYLSKVTD